MKSLECNDSNFKSNPLFNREPMRLNKQRSGMFTPTAGMTEPGSTIKATADVEKYILADHRAAKSIRI